LYLLALVLCTGNLHAQVDSTKLQFINTLKPFIKNELGLSITDNFYSEWEKYDDSIYLYLYVSEPDRVQVPADMPAFYGFNSDVKGLDSLNKIMKHNCYQTFVYKTAGRSNVKLNRTLVSYPLEAIAFIVIHEAVHNHLANTNTHFKYEYIEALCDAVAVYGTNLFTSRYGLINAQALYLQNSTFERLYESFNEVTATINGPQPNHAYYLTLYGNAKVKSLATDGNAFVQQRMLYPFNNAYLVRNISYARHYFEIKEMIGERLVMEEVISELIKISSSR
jgi:hypothetical protein